ncbi:MAG: molybdate ABC transporter substrate-binding protein [Actinomycetota bacterium]|nr:molybdate ABC transporter substrate-binding protein [Actinomycetota bacterium]
MRALVTAVLAVVLVAGCGGPEGHLTVYAATSLTEAFERLAPDARFNFAGSDELARQLEEGARADVYASADPRYALRLFRERLVERPRALVANQVVLAVPTSNPARIGRIHDLARPGVKLVLGAPGVPVGDYARRALARRADGPSIIRHVVSEEQDVKAVLAKLELGEADAGFVYASDVDAAKGKVRALYPAVADAAYAIAVVRSGDGDRARAFLDRVFSREGRRALLHAGFVAVPTAGEPLP